MAGATIVDNFTIGGNTLGALSWDGRLGEWYTGFGLQGHWEDIQCDRFRSDINGYLSGANSRYRDIEVSPWMHEQLSSACSMCPGCSQA